MTKLHKFIKEIPPGQLQDALQDIHSLLGRQGEHKQGDWGEEFVAAVEAYNEEQLTVVKVREVDAIVSKITRTEKGMYVDALNGVSFAYDHISGVVSSIELCDKLQVAWAGQIEDYCRRHYPSSHAYTVCDKDNVSHILLVCNKYNPRNFWSGRWRATYNLDGCHLTGSMDVDLHYNEDGNVRFKANRKVDEKLDSVEEIGKAIERLERDFHRVLVEEMDGLNLGAFKALRRALPITRQRMDWSNVAQYQLL